MKKTLLFLTTFLVALSFIACTKNNTDIDEGIDDDIDMSLVDFSNIELLFGQSLPVVQKCMEGKWKLIRISSGWGADKFPNDGEYMIISNERIIMGNDTDGIKIDSPVIWEGIVNLV